MFVLKQDWHSPFVRVVSGIYIFYSGAPVRSHNQSMQVSPSLTGFHNRTILIFSGISPPIRLPIVLLLLALPFHRSVVRYRPVDWFRRRVDARAFPRTGGLALAGCATADWLDTLGAG